MARTLGTGSLYEPSCSNGWLQGRAAVRQAVQAWHSRHAGAAALDGDHSAALQWAVAHLWHMGKSLLILS